LNYRVKVLLSLLLLQMLFKTIDFKILSLLLWDTELISSILSSSLVGESSNPRLITNSLAKIRFYLQKVKLFTFHLQSHNGNLFNK
jgi:hypothetical protein